MKTVKYIAVRKCDDGRLLVSLDAVDGLGRLVFSDHRHDFSSAEKRAAFATARGLSKGYDLPLVVVSRSGRKRCVYAPMSVILGQGVDQ